MTTIGLGEVLLLRRRWPRPQHVATVAAVLAFPILERAIGLYAAVGVVLGMIAVAVSAIRPDAAVVTAIVISVLFARELPLPRVPLGGRGLDIVIAVPLLWYFANVRMTWRTSSRPKLLGGVLAVFLATVALAAVAGLTTPLQRAQALVELQRLSPLLLFYPATLLLRSDRRRASLYVALIVAGAIASVWSVYSALTGSVVQLEFGFPRIVADLPGRYGDILRPSELTSTNYFAVLPVLCVAYWGFAQDRRVRLLIAASLALSLAALAVDLNRTRWIEALVAILVWAAIRARVRSERFGVGTRIVQAAVALTGMMAVVLVTRSWSAIELRLAELTDPLAIGGVAFRFGESAGLIAAFLNSPILGQGLGASIVIYDPIREAFVRVTNWHDDFLFVLAKIGIIGFAGLAALVVAALLVGWRMKQLPEENVMLHRVDQAGYAIFIASLIPSVTHSSLFAPDYVAFVAVLLAVFELHALPVPSPTGSGDDTESLRGG